jgi:hypothetical protein
VHKYGIKLKVIELDDELVAEIHGGWGHAINVAKRHGYNVESLVYIQIH